jgi:hypothetical protein
MVPAKTPAVACSSSKTPPNQHTSVNIVSLKELGAIINDFTTNNTTTTALESLTLPDTMDTRHAIRLQIKISGFNKHDNLVVKLGKFMSAAKNADFTFAMKPVAQGNPNKLPHIETETNLQHTKDLSKYFHPTGPNQMWSLSGHVYIESQYPSTQFIQHLSNWCKNGNHRISYLQCQSDETIQLGFLIRSSVTIYRDDLKTAIMQHPLWAQSGSFEFGLTIRLLHSPKLSVPTLCIETTKPHAAQAAEFFTTIYDGEYDELPLGINLLFFSTYNCAASNNDRSTLAQEQERFLTSERTITIKGLHPLDTKIRLATDDLNVISIRSLLLLLPITTNTTPLFHGIDRQHDPTIPFIIAKYPEHHSDELIKTIPMIDTAIKIRSHTDDHDKIFINTNEGLTFGAEFQNYKNKKILRTPLHIPSETSRLQLQNIIQKITSITHKRPPPYPTYPRSTTKKHAWSHPNPSSSNTTVTSLSTSSLDHSITPSNRPQDTQMAIFENKLAKLQTDQNNTNLRIDVLDTNITQRMNTIDESIQSLSSTSHQNFGLLMAQFGISPVQVPTATDIPTPSTPSSETHDHNNMEVDTDSRKRERQLRLGSARYNTKK